MPTGYEVTKEDVRKMQSRESRQHPGGIIPKDSMVAGLQSMVNSRKGHGGPEATSEKLPQPETSPIHEEQIAIERERTGGIGSGRVGGDPKTDALRVPVPQESAVRGDADKVLENLEKGKIEPLLDTLD